MRLLPAAKREALFALYDVARAIDDVADGPGTPDERRAGLDAWRAQIAAIYDGTPDDPAALRLQPQQVGPLVLVALARDQLGRLIRRRFASVHACVAQRLEVERGQVLALEVGDQIGRREQSVALNLLHRRSAPPSSSR